MLEQRINQRSINLTGLLLPLADRNLILPNVAVAELIDYQPAAFDLDTPPWYLGRVTWRNRQISAAQFRIGVRQQNRHRRAGADRHPQRARWPA
jgi:chemosensory pili system protein ChpC